MMFTENTARHLNTRNDRAFFDRAHKTPQSDYVSRLKAVSFSGMSKVCDAGCGYGQWSFSLAKLNQAVQGIDSSAGRISVCQSLLDDNPSYKNILKFSVADIQQTGFPDRSFDGVFSYSVIYLTDYRKTLCEFHRILQPGGRLYLSTNDVGWYAHNLIDRPNATPDYDPRDMAIRAISGTVSYFSSGEYIRGSSIIMPIQLVIGEMNEMGLRVISSGPDGTINETKTAEQKRFFEEEYYGCLGPYEILAEKEE
jgi:SAM-dependent methyltransferase